MDTVVDVLVSWFPMIVLIAVWIYFTKKMKYPQEKSVAYMEKQNELISKSVEYNERIAIALEKLAEK